MAADEQARIGIDVPQPVEPALERRQLLRIKWRLRKIRRGLALQIIDRARLVTVPAAIMQRGGPDEGFPGIGNHELGIAPMGREDA